MSPNQPHVKNINTLYYYLTFCIYCRYPVGFITEPLHTARLQPRGHRRIGGWGAAGNGPNSLVINTLECVTPGIGHVWTFVLSVPDSKRAVGPGT